MYVVSGNEPPPGGLQKQADALKAAIEAAYTGTFERDGYKLTVSAKITATVYSSQKDAEASGAQNVVGYIDRDFGLGMPEPISKEYGITPSDYVATTWKENRESFDRMLVTRSVDADTYPHEFAHGLGEGRHFGVKSVLRSYSGPDFRKITTEDFHNLLGYNVSRHIQQSLNPRIVFWNDSVWIQNHKVHAKK